MSIRIRKLIGVFALFALVIVWALLAMALAQFPPIFNNGLARRPVLPGRRHRLGAAGDAAGSLDVEGNGQVTLTGRKPFHSAGGGARDQHLGIARALEIAVERDARQRGQMLPAWLGKMTPGRVVTAVLKPSSAAILNSRGPAEVRSPTG